jgi:hypothetical protein
MLRAVGDLQREGNLHWLYRAHVEQILGPVSDAASPRREEIPGSQPFDIDPTEDIRSRIMPGEDFPYVFKAALRAVAGRTLPAVRALPLAPGTKTAEPGWMTWSPIWPPRHRRTRRSPATAEVRQTPGSRGLS